MEGILASVEDGAASAQHPVLGKADYAGLDRLAFAYYIDDVEVCNPIWAARGRHKIMLQYVQLLNLPNHCRSHLGNIFLVGVKLRKSLDKLNTKANGHCGVHLLFNAPGPASFQTVLKRFDSPEGIKFYLPTLWAIWPSVVGCCCSLLTRWQRQR